MGRVAELAADVDAIAGLGHNQPPEPTPFDAHKANIDDLYDEAKGWLDGEPIASQGQADKVGLLLGLIREAEKAADAERVKEKAHLDEQIKEIQERYAPLIADTKTTKGKTVLAAEACKAALAPWLKKLEDEQKAAALLARQQAQAAADAAAEAIRAAPVENLTARQDAEALVTQAKAAEKVAARAEKARPQTAGHGRAVTLRSVWSAVMTDETEAARGFWLTHRAECVAFYQGLADQRVAAGARELRGFTVKEDRVPV